MARNVEIKASVASPADLEQRAAAMASSPPTLIDQDDTFFRCDNGRLKLRSLRDGTGELIFYRRADAAGPKVSSYEVVPIREADRLCSALGQACGVVGRVRKQRTLYIVGGARVHLDQVEGLGAFMEVEVVLAEGESEASGIREARELMAALGIPESALIDRAYVDLLNEKGT